MKTEIETLKKMADEQDEAAKDCEAHAEPYRPPWGTSMRKIWEAKAALARANADVLRAAVALAERAERLPKTKDGVTVWPGDWIWTWHKEPNGNIVATRDSALTNWHCLYLTYSTEAAARDAADKATGGTHE